MDFQELAEAFNYSATLIMVVLFILITVAIGTIIFFDEKDEKEIKTVEDPFFDKIEEFRNDFD